MESWTRSREVEKPKPVDVPLGQAGELTLLITHEASGVYVWIGCRGDHPIYGHGFIIGHGDTRDDAAREAVKALENATARLQAQPGVIREATSK